VLWLGAILGQDCRERGAQLGIGPFQQRGSLGRRQGSRRLIQLFQPFPTARASWRQLSNGKSSPDEHDLPPIQGASKREDAVLDAQPSLCHFRKRVRSVKDGVQENKGVAEVELGRPEFLRLESPAQDRIIKFGEMQQGRLTALDEFEAGTVNAAGIQGDPAGE